MPPLVHPRTRTLLDTQTPSVQALGSSMAGRAVFILCIVFGSLVCLLLAAIAIYCTRRKRKRRSTTKIDLHRDASFTAGAPSVVDIAPPPPRRPSSRIAAPLPRIAIPSPELGSVFRFDTVSSLVRRGSSVCTPTRPSSVASRPRSESALTLKPPAPNHNSLFSTTSTVVAPSEPDKYDVPLRVINPSPRTPLSTIVPQVQKPSPAYQAGLRTSRERLVSSTASADSSLSRSTSTPPLSPLGTWSHIGTNTIDSPTDVTSRATSVHKTVNQQSASSLTSPPHISVEYYEMSSYLADAEPRPRVHDPLSSDRPLGITGTPVTLSHFPFRFSAGASTSPGLSSIGSPVPSSSLGALSPRLSQPHLGTPSGHLRGLGLNRVVSGQSSPARSTPPLKLKVQHNASDEIIAIVFVPQTINFQAVADAVHGRLGLKPQRIWSDEGVDIVDDASLWSWIEDQYIQGHTRLLLHVE